MEKEKEIPEKGEPGQEGREERPEQREKPEKKKKAAPKKEEPAGPGPAEKLEEELAAQKDQYLRVLAEYDNFRKRTQQEKMALYNNAVSDTVQALLPIADNIERALSQENASAEDLRKGLEMIESQIGAAWERLGITAIGAVGEAFDPALHNAVAHIEDESLGENVISAVFQKGYVLGDRVVRHAMVQVAN